MPRSEYAQLIYLSTMLWQPFFDPGRAWGDWAVIVGVVALFVPIFVLGHHPDRRVKQAALAATIILGIVATPLNVGASVLFVYAAAVVALIDRRHLVQWQAGLTGLCLVLAAVSPVPWPYQLFGILPPVVFIWVIGWLVRADARRSEEAERLRIDNVRIEQLATADERERIARDLHDLVGQSLTALVVKAQLVQGLIDTQPDLAGVHAADLEEAARDALAQVRAAIDGLGQVALEDEIDAAGRILTTAGVDLTVTVDTDGQLPGPLVERILALALREATTNVVRHAAARTCRITMRRTPSVWELVIADDGLGGDVEEGNGLRGMRERVVAVGGSVRRGSSDVQGTNSGTTVTVTVPT